MGSKISGRDQGSADTPDIVTSPWEEQSIDLPDITDDNERARAVWVSADGLVRFDGDDQQRVDVSTAMIVSDRRLLFVARGGDGDSPSGTYSLAYADLATVNVRETEVCLTTTGGVTWEAPLPSGDPDGLEAVLAHLRWIGTLRARTIGCQNDVELAAGQIREHAHALDWERAESSYTDVREQLDTLICDVQLVEPVAAHYLSPELTEIERTLERAHTRLYIEHAKSALALGRHLIEGEEYSRARERLREAQRYYDRAREQRDAVERTDSFQFGPQRKLQDDLENLGWEMETVTAEPIRQAHEAKIQAQFADDPEAALDHWEAAFGRYGHVLTLEWDDDGRNFAGNPEEVRDEREFASERIIELRNELAQREWDTGATCHQEGENAVALNHCTNAVDHLERVRALAGEFGHSGPPDIESRLDRMRAVVEQVRNEVSGSAPEFSTSVSGVYSGNGPRKETGADDDTEGRAASDSGPTATPDRSDGRDVPEDSPEAAETDATPTGPTSEQSGGADRNGDRRAAGGSATNGATGGGGRASTLKGSDLTTPDSLSREGDRESHAREEPPSVDELSDLDTHHDITIEMDADSPLSRLDAPTDEETEGMLDSDSTSP